MIEYENYLKGLLGKLFEEFYSCTADHSLSDQLAKTVLLNFGARIDII